jgi:hypothetical protein
LDRAAFAELRINALTALSDLPTNELEQSGITKRLARLLSIEEPIDIQLAAVNFFALQRTPFAIDSIRAFGKEKGLAPELKAAVQEHVQ